MDILIGVGIAIIGGYFFGKILNLLKVPAVAGYIIAGLLLGNSFLGILGDNFIERTGVISDLALAIIAFSIGGELVIHNLKRIGFKVFLIAFLEAITAFVLVGVSMLFLKQTMSSALLLGAVAAATAPAATVMVLNELHAKGPLTSTLIAVVAIDDAICLMIYAIASSIAKILLYNEKSISWLQVLSSPFIEIGGSLLLGIIIGGILVFILRHITSNSEILVIIAAGILITVGIANQFGFSALLSNMTVGIMVSNLSSKKLKAFSVVESISSPIYIAFFVLAGSRLQVNMLLQVGIVGLVYTVARMAGKISGASLAAVITKADTSVKKYLGFGLLSQIGVAVGLAIVISKEFAGTQVGDLIITILLATTIVTEIVGPLLTRLVIIKSGEANQGIIENELDGNIGKDMQNLDLSA